MGIVSRNTRLGNAVNRVFGPFCIVVTDIADVNKTFAGTIFVSGDVFPNRCSLHRVFSTFRVLHLSFFEGVDECIVTRIIVRP